MQLLMRSSSSLKFIGDNIGHYAACIHAFIRMLVVQAALCSHAR